MNRMLLTSVTLAVTGCLLAANVMVAQESPSTQKARHVRIIEGPAVEISSDVLTIITWTTNNPGGSPVHYGVVHYGLDSKNLSETARSPIRLNPDHQSTIFRVRLDQLKPGTTYYYTVASLEGTGADDGTKSAVKRFTTPGQSQRASR